LRIPTTIEIDKGPGKAPDRMVIERVLINPAIEDRIFARPVMFHGSGAATIGLGMP
jgi:hypothetical protein